MKTSWKQISAILLCLLVLLGGCGSQAVQSTVSDSWTVDADIFAGSYTWAEKQGQTLYALDSANTLHRWQAADGVQLQTLSLESFVAQFGNIQAVACGETEIWALLMQAEAAPAAELLHLDWNGAVQSQTTLSAEALFPEETEPLLSFSAIRTLETAAQRLPLRRGS